MVKNSKTAVWKDPTLLARLVLAVMWITVFFFSIRALTAIVLGGAGFYDDTTLDFTGPQMVTVIIDLLGLLVVISWLLIPFWIFRIAKNAHTFGRRLEHSAASAIWWYFVPVMALVMPFRVMREVWNVSAMSREARTDHKELVAWWTLHVAAGIVALPAMQLAEELPALDILSDALFASSSLAFLLVVRRMTSMQKAAHTLRETEEVWG